MFAVPPPGTGPPPTGPPATLPPGTGLFQYIYTSLFARKAAATIEKKHQKHNNKNKQTKEKKTTLKSGELVKCYHIYTPTNSKKYLHYVSRTHSHHIHV